MNMPKKPLTNRQWRKYNAVIKRRATFAKLVRQWEDFKVWVCSLWCKAFHKEDYVCWDDFWRDHRESPLPGPRSLLCQRCMRAWHEPNPDEPRHRNETAFEYDSDKKMWTIYKDEEYLTRFFVNPERKENDSS